MIRKIKRRIDEALKLVLLLFHNILKDSLN